MSDSNSIESRVLALAEPIAEELGLDVLELHVSPGDPGTVRVVIERSGVSGPGSGVNISEITRLSKSLGYILEEEEVLPFAYRFEVSSPGVERNLRTDKDFERFLGAPVKAVGLEPLKKGQYAIQGILKSYDAETLELELKGGERLTVVRAGLRRIRNVYDFSAALARK